MAGLRVAFTGRFAATSQVGAGELVEALGGKAVAFPSRSTSYLVIGQESWPLGGDGRLTLSLRRARELQGLGTGIKIISEQRFLELAGLANTAADAPLRRLYTTTQLSRVLHVPGPRIRSWVRRGLIHPARTRHHVDYFDFRQVAALRTVSQLTARGVHVDAIRRGIEQARQWLPDAQDALALLALIEGEKELVLRLPGGAVAQASGQLQLPVEAKEQPGATLDLGVAAPGPEDWFERAVRLEEVNDLEGAARAYQQHLLAVGPHAEAAFNLGNVLATLGRPEEALARFREALATRADFVEAWNNQAGVLADLGRWTEAVEAAAKALDLAPDYADAHYNMALALVGMGRRDEALAHGRKYLAHDTSSSWAQRLRGELGLDRPS